MMTIAYIAVGSNLGNRETYLAFAREALSKTPGIRLLRASQVYETSPQGGPPQGKFLNAVWEIETSLMPRELLKKLLTIERNLGRERKIKNGPRTIDLDIIFYGGLVVYQDDLTIPHPRLSERWFVLKPLWDLASDFVHPISGKSVCELLDECSASYSVA